MVKKIILNPKKDIVRPTQPKIYDEEGTLNRLFSKLNSKPNLVVPPISLRINPENEGEFLCLDGHRRYVIFDLFEKNINGLIYETREEFWEAVKHMKLPIIQKWDYSTSAKRKSICPSSFTELRGKYPHLVNLESAKKYYTKK